MTKIYADLIRKGKKTINDVPERLRAEVRRILEETYDYLTGRSAADE